MSTVQRAPRLAPPAVPAARTAPVRRAPLRAVPTGAGVGRARAARGPFVLLVGLLLSAGLIGLLLLNTALGQGSFTVHDLDRKADQLDDQAQALQRQLARAESPEQLAARAQALGMVPSENPAFVRAADGKVLGVPKPGQAPPAPPAAPAAASAPKSATTGSATTGSATTGSATTKSATTKSATTANAKPGTTTPTGASTTKAAPSNGSTKNGATGASSASRGATAGTLGPSTHSTSTGSTSTGAAR